MTATTGAEMDHTQHIVEAVLMMAIDREDDALRSLARARCYGPVSDALETSVRAAVGWLSNELVRETEPYLELEARYQRVCDEFHVRLEGQITACEEAISETEARIRQLEKDNPTWE